MVKASREFQIFAKPAGAACNLDCSYCYYLRKDLLYPESGPFRMADDLLEEYIREQIVIAPEPEISFFWHGGLRSGERKQIPNGRDQLLQRH